MKKQTQHVIIGNVALFLIIFLCQAVSGELTFPNDVMFSVGITFLGIGVLNIIAAVVAGIAGSGHTAPMLVTAAVCFLLSVGSCSMAFQGM